MYWVAREWDGNLIRQFDENHQEHYIPELEGKKLISVGYYDEMVNQYYLASLVTGTFYFPDKNVETDRDFGKRSLILKREHTITGNFKTTKYIFGFYNADNMRIEANTENSVVYKYG